MWDYYYPDFTDKETKATSQGSGRNGIMNQDILAAEPTVLTNTPPASWVCRAFSWGFVLIEVQLEYRQSTRQENVIGKKWANFKGS